MMKADGWVAGYSENWGVKYWSFRRNGFEIAWNDIDDEIFDSKDSKHFKAWRKE